MIEKVLQWCGIVFAVVGVVCLFLEAIGSIRKHNNTKLSILSLVFLTISLVGYIITEVVLRSKGLPSFFSVVWVVFLWAYLICNLVSYLKINKKNRALKKSEKAIAEQSESVEILQETEGAEQAAQEQPSAEVTGDERLAETPVAETQSEEVKEKSGKPRKTEKKNK